MSSQTQRIYRFFVEDISILFLYCLILRSIFAYSHSFTTNKERTHHCAGGRFRNFSGLSHIRLLRLAEGLPYPTKKGRPDFNTLTEDQLEAGMSVHGDIDLALGAYAESYETDLGIRTSDESSSLYYLIPIFDRAGDGKIRYLITFHAEPEDFDTLDKIVAQTWSGEPITTRLTVDDGYIGRLPDKFKQYFLEWAHDDMFYENGSFIDWCKEYNVFGTDDEAAIEARFVPFRIYREDMSFESGPIYAWAFGGTSILIVIGMVLLIRYKVPIKGFEDTPPKEDFNRVRELSGE